MGGLMKAPKPVVVTASPPPAAPATATPAAVAATAQAARLENQGRAQRGLAGTIVTSDRGVLTAAPPLAGARKTLLGE